MGGTRRNQDVRARSKSARRLQAQVAADGGERRKGRAGEGRGGRRGRKGKPQKGIVLV